MVEPSFRNVRFGTFETGSKLIFVLCFVLFCVCVCVLCVRRSRTETVLNTASNGVLAGNEIITRARSRDPCPNELEIEYGHLQIHRGNKL